MVIAFGLFTVSLGAYGALAWSLVPVGVSGTIDRIEYQSDTGSRFRDLTLKDGTTWVIDRQVAHLFDRDQGPTGQVVHKQPWSRSIQVGDRTESVAPSAEVWKVLFALAAVALAAVMRTLRAHRRSTTELGEPEPAASVP